MTAQGVTTDYAYDGTMLVREFQINQPAGLLAPSATFMIGPMGPCCRINEQNQTEGYYPVGVTSTTPLTRGVTRWYVYDGLGSKIAELDDNNNMTTSRQYDVYGAPRLGTQQGVAGTSSVFLDALAGACCGALGDGLGPFLAALAVTAMCILLMNVGDFSQSMKQDYD
jgi:hypothetical protein